MRVVRRSGGGQVQQSGLKISERWLDERICSCAKRYARLRQIYRFARFLGEHVLQPSHNSVPPRDRYRAVASLCGGIVQRLDRAAPQLFIHAVDSPVVGQQSVYLSFNICSLRPDATRASVTLNLFAKLNDVLQGSIVPGLRGICELVSCLLGKVIEPSMVKTELLTDTAELALQADTRWVIGRVIS